jgi:polypeptide N-acetylgalactosaminyltransferase
MQLAVMDQVRNLGLGGKTCLDSPARKADLHKPAGLYPCHNQGGNQVRNLCLQMAAVSAAEHTSNHRSCYHSCADI